MGKNASIRLNTGDKERNQKHWPTQPTENDGLLAKILADGAWLDNQLDIGYCKKRYEKFVLTKNELRTILLIL